MKRTLFASLHTLLLGSILVVPKTLKVGILAPEATWADYLLVAAPDIVFVLAAELCVFWIAAALPKRPGKWLRAGWGASLLPLVAFLGIEHRFFLATGSILDWHLFWHGLARAREIGGVVRAEIPPVWWVILSSSIPLGTVFAWLGWQTPAWRPLHGNRRAGVALFLAISILALTSFVGGPYGDPRLVLLRRSIPVSMGIEAASGLKVAIFGTGDVYLDYDLPEPVRLEATDESQLDNIVLLILESARADAMTPYVPELDTSPFTARLAKEGMLVERAYTVMPHTTKSLVPILCGYSPDVRQALSETVPNGLPGPCLPRMLEPLGYSSAHFQPASGKFEQREMLTAMAGFDTFVAWEDIKRKGWESPNYLGVEDRAIIKPMMDWVDKQEGPFLLSVLTLISHHDYQVPSNFPKKTYEGIERWSDYLNTIRYTDMFVQEVFNEFESRGLLDRTLFLIVGDHGEGHGEHGRKGHDAIVYEEGIRVPAIFWSRHLIPEPRVIRGNRQHMDWLPTLVDLMGIEVDDGAFEGRSVLEPVDDRVIHVSCWYRNRCLGRLEGDSKFIHYYGRSPDELFDLGRDPGEKTNLNESLSEQTRGSYIEELKAWKRSKQLIYLANTAQRGRGSVLLKAPEPDHLVDAKLGQRLQVVGFDTPYLSAGKTARVVVYVKVLRTLGWHRKFELEIVDYRSKVHRLRFRSTERDHPMFSWVPDLFMKVAFEFELPENVAAGPAELRLSVRFGKRGREKVEGLDVDENRKCAVLQVDVRP